MLRKVKLLSLSAAISCVGIATHAGSLAEPVPTVAPVVVPAAPVFDWSGHYAGGYLFHGNGSYEQQDTAGDLGVDVDVDGTGLGLRYGHNWQSGSTIYGVDVSVQTGLDGTTPQGTTGPFWSCTTGDCNVAIDALMTLRGRYGMTFGDGRTMGYGALGLAAGKIDGGIYNSNQQGTSTAVGYTAGLGLERMMTDRISIYGEVNYVDLGDIDFGTDGGTETFFGDGSFSTLALGVNYAF
ncbi:outer membrane protein [Thalassorhabdomicrobium marinisediminis]|uniref:outer membrane protein n=1 Tax=Thalassorhabdomicrobium marinisediminis TaxID=2170577 RepID=UPI00248F7BFD|nr:outer membrane beta-barrel protein [Thalassorhabdomicrobium marinisediminis]